MLYQLAADWAPHSEVVVEYRETFSAEGVSAVNEYSRDTLSHIKLFTAVVAKVETTNFVISLDQLLVLLFSFFTLILLLGF